MASEITITNRLQVTKGNLSLDRFTTINADMAGTHASFIVQNIGTSYEALEIGSNVASSGYAYVRNNDATNYVEIGRVVSSTFYPAIKLKAGETALFRIGGALFGQANTAACDVEITVLEA
jgi:hypothetical protein